MMKLSPSLFIDSLKQRNIDFFAGVPDSLLKSICAYISDHLESKNNIITSNEGGAVGIAAGYYLATKKIPVVYMQNSGIGNAVNPLLSLMDKEVYNLPLLMLIGWRGEPGIKDEPQHIKQGMVTIPLLESMGIKHEVLTKNNDLLGQQLDDILGEIAVKNEPYALIVQKETFGDYELQEKQEVSLPMSREFAIQQVVDSMRKNSVVVSTTGKISRELFEYREAKKESHNCDFLTVGSMGHASQIALGIAMQKPNVNTYCLDGDGATIMHMGSLAIVGTVAPSNYIHLVFNNGAHDSVGGQPTAGFKIDLTEIAKSCGYKHVYRVDDKMKLSEVLDEIKSIEGPIFLEVLVKKGSRKDLGRPTSTPLQNRDALLRFLEDK